MKKTMKVLAAAAVFTACFATAAQAGWEQDAEGKYSYLLDSGAYARDQIMEIDGVSYGFDSGAYMMTGWNLMNGEWYYFEDSGAMSKGWKDLGGTWYYLDPSTGAMKSGKFKVGAALYCTDTSGALQVGTMFDGPDGYAYEADETGAILRNTSREDGKGNIFKYEDDGRIRIANTSTRNISKAEGGSFLSEDYLTLADFAAFKTEIQEHADEAIGSVKDELYEAYLDAMEEATTYKKKQRKKTKWESKVKSKLEALSVSEDDINTFISQVENGTYLPYGEVDESNYDDAYDDDYDYDDDDDEDDDD